MDDIDKTYWKLKRISYQEMENIFHDEIAQMVGIAGTNFGIDINGWYEKYGWTYDEFVVHYFQKEENNG